MGIGAKIVWRGPQVIRTIETEMEKRLRRIGETVASHCRRKMSTSTRANGPSAAGDRYPHADTSRLRSSVTYNIENRGAGEWVAIVGTNVSYSVPLHEGVDGQEGRPFLLSSIEDKKSEIVSILNRPMRGGKK